METTNPGPRFLDAATVQERIDDVGLLERRLEEDPGDLIANARLETIYRTEGAWDKLVKLLLDRAESLASSEETGLLLAEVAGLFRDRLGDVERARIVLLTAFEEAPRSPEIADALDNAAYATGQWSEVIAAYERAALELEESTPAVASELMLRVACAHIVGSGDWSRIGTALGRVRALDPERSRSYLDMVERMATGDDALETVAEVCERIGDTPRMMRALSRAAAAATDVLRRAHFHHSIAGLYRELGDRAAAEWHFEETLRLDPSRSDALESLASIYRARGDYRDVAELLERSRACAQSRTARVRLGLQAAEIYAEDLGEQTHAIDLYAAALADDPDHVGAAVPLADRYFDEERWQELEPMLDMLTRRAGELLGDDRAAWVRLLYRAGHCATRLGKFTKARRHYESVLEIDDLHLPSLLECADAYCELGFWDAAFETLNAALVVQRGNHCPPEELARTLFRMGEARWRSGDSDAALTLYESSLEVARSDAALEAAAALYRERGDHAAMAALLERQLERADGRTRVELLVELAGVVSRKLGDYRRAIGLYQSALEVEPDNRHVLHELIELYSAAELWREAVQTILLMADLEDDPLKRGKYYQAAGVISRHHLDPEAAIDFLNRALDCFFQEAEALPRSFRPGCMKAFTDIGKILYDRQDWKTLERNYRRMIKRLNSEAPELPELWHGLGQIYRKHLGHRASAISSFEIASALDSDRITHHRVLVHLYEEAGPEKLGDAIARRRRLLEAEPFSGEHYAALRSLFQSAGQYDKVWCACRALAFLGHADPGELDYYQKMRPSHPVWPRTPLTEHHFALLRHPGEDPRLSSILGIVAEPAALVSSVSARRYGLRDDPHPSHNHLRGLFDAVRYALAAHGATGVVQPELHADVLLANIERDGSLEPVFVMGRGLYQGQTVNAILHALARTLSHARPVHYLRLAIPNPADLESALLAACAMSRPDVRVPPALAPAVKRYASSIRKRLSPHWEGQLEQMVAQLAASESRHDLEAWGRAVDASARRTGLLLTGDLETAVADIAREPAYAGGPTHEEKVRDLLLHSVSEEHFELRAGLGLGIV